METRMKTGCKFVVALGALALSLCAAQAKTLAWYRFEDVAKGVTARDTVFTNSVDGSLYPAYPGVCAYTSNDKYPKDTLSYDSAHMPVCTNAFPSAIALVDPNDTCAEYANDGAVALNIDKIDDANNPVGAVFVDDHEDLRLQNGTIEFFARLPDTSQKFRCLMARSGRVYSSANTSFNVYGQLLSSGDMYLVLEVAAVDGEPLRGANGAVTNGTCYKAPANFTGSCLDNDRWHHVALTIDGVAKKATLYVDYVSRASVTYKGDILYEEGMPLAFGAHPMCTYYGSSELIDEVRISDAVLSSDQMLGYRRRSPSSAGCDKNTLLYFPFEGANESQTLGEGDMQEPVVCNPFLANRAAGSFAKVSASFYQPSTSSGGYDPQADADEVPASAVRPGLRSLATYADAQSLHAVTNGTGEGTLRSVALPVTVTAADLFGESCTVECFLRLAETGYLASQSQSHLLCLWSAFQVKTICGGTSSDGYLSFSVGDTNLLGPNGKGPAKFVADGKWHHVAVVYDKENDRAEAFVDYGLVASADSPTMNLGAHKSYYNGLMIGGSYWGDRQLGNAWIDEVRVSRGALRSYQFLTSAAAECDLLAVASFEDDLVMRPYTNFFGVAGEAKAFVSGASAPTYSPSRLARTFTEGPGGAVLVGRNARSLAFDGGMVIWRDRGLLADSDEFTVEFLMRGDAAAAGAGVARVNRGSSTDVTSAVTWALSFADAAGHLSLKVDTDAREGQTHVFDGESFADGSWHHVALQFARSGANTEARLYRDAALVGDWAVEGRLVTAPRLVNFMLGAGENPSVGFVGGIDEIRVSPGVVPPDRFMTPVRQGMLFIVR